MLDFEQIKSRVEEAIRAGNREQARAILTCLKGEAIPRARASSFATLARRAGLLPLALKIMLPFIRPAVPLDKEASDEEKATYAIILLGIGASTEALEILATGNPQNSEINLALAFTHINRWDYVAAVRFLRNYLSIDGMIPYQRMVARVNLAASYVALGDVHEGKPLLEQIMVATAENHWHLLHKNALELSAQLALQEQDWVRANQLLERAALSAGNGFNLEDFFVRKWKAVMAVLRGDSPAQALAELNLVREVALQNGHWETVRDCDFHRALATKDEALLSRVYFGTPYESFRNRITKHSAGWFNPPASFVWEMSGEKASRIFDLRTGEESGSDVRVKPGKGLHQALSVLTSDFYKPFVIGSLHSSLFPGEHFNPISSPRRVSFLIHRVREWLSESNIPVVINAGKEGYRIEAEAPYAFLMGAASAPVDSGEPAHYQIMFEKLKSRWPDGAFGAADAAEHLGVSMRTARYFVKWALEGKKLKRLGSGRSTQYRMGR